MTLPNTTFAHDAAVFAVMQEFFSLIELEINTEYPVVTSWRRALLAAAWSDSERMPEVTDTDVEVWFWLYDPRLISFLLRRAVARHLRQMKVSAQQPG